MEDQLLQIAIWILPLIFAITVHEVAHGWVAKYYGDKTAFMQGRLTLNPIKHIDLIGTIILPGVLLLLGTGFIFGWAKPVPVDTRNFKNINHDMALVALAGPMSNFLMALVWALSVRIGVILDIDSISSPLKAIGSAGIQINIVFGLLNLIPLPPLDGSRILSGMLSPNLAYKYNKLEPYGFPILMVLMMTHILGIILGLPLMLLMGIFSSIAGL